MSDSHRNNSDEKADEPDYSGMSKEEITKAKRLAGLAKGRATRAANKLAGIKTVYKKKAPKAERHNEKQTYVPAPQKTSAKYDIQSASDESDSDEEEKIILSKSKKKKEKPPKTPPAVVKSDKLMKAMIKKMSAMEQKLNLSVMTNIPGETKVAKPDLPKTEVKEVKIAHKVEPVKPKETMMQLVARLNQRL